MDLKKSLYKLKRRLFHFVRITEKNKQSLVLNISGNTIFIVKLYYFLFDHSFDREMQSVFLGKKIHHEKLQKKLPNISKLRREIHRIEKGLIIPNRKSFFANGYIDSTVDAFISTYEYLDDLNRKWSKEVLDLYFNEIGLGNKNIDLARSKYLDFSKSLMSKEKNHKSTPFPFADLSTVTIDVEDLFSLAKRRHSVRFFQDKKVEKEVLERAISIGLEAPSACNRQPFELLFIDDKSLIKKAVELPMGVTTFKEEIQNLAIVIGDLSYYFDERDRHLIYIDGSLFTMGFLLGLESQGVSSCVINWPDIESRENDFHKLFNIPNHKRGICFIALGYAKNDGLIPFSEKKDYSKILRINEKYTN
ncbi:nitroreductase family protein [Algibacter mikhailovii]|uniref:Nitroreductase domain-containing protein n=1 Tax=Algibacter mikhailovii TaxID=425498 RepID=A0A918R273_9FLAO|nr:nitroreductase family protein [Algibacter mikhailovii]GGZ81078.1 hypothetical protein GCM10007028_18130 [Algibacter mikhailovii]